MHLRNTLAKGMDAESYSLHTFEALLSQSMENLELAESLPGSNQRSPYPMRRRSGSAKSSTLPLPHGRPVQIRERDRERDGYYSDRNELVRERERERERGYLSDHNSGYACPLCFLSVIPLTVPSSAHFQLHVPLCFLHWRVCTGPVVPSFRRMAFGQLHSGLRIGTRSDHVE